MMTMMEFRRGIVEINQGLLDIDTHKENYVI